MTDTSPDSIYLAVGKATNRWETLEAHLSYLYSIFEGRPVDHRLIEDYGRENSIFKNRMDRLEKSAEKYFQSKPDQREEGRVQALISEARRLSSYRHNIAHGIVYGVEIGGHSEFRLTAPSHGFYHLTKKTGDYSYASADIDRYGDQFAQLATDVQRFNHERHPPQWPKESRGQAK